MKFQMIQSWVTLRCRCPDSKIIHVLYHFSKFYHLCITLLFCFLFWCREWTVFAYMVLIFVRGPYFAQPVFRSKNPGKKEKLFNGMVVFPFHNSIKTVGGEDTIMLERTFFSKKYTCSPAVPYFALMTASMKSTPRSSDVHNVQIGLPQLPVRAE